MAEYNPNAVADLAVRELTAKPLRARKAAEQYRTAVFDELIYSYYVLANMDQINNNTLPFSLNRVRKKLGRYSSKNLYWWDWLHKTFPLVKIIKKGNNIQGAVSMVEPQIPLKIILASGDAKAVVRSIYSAHDLESELHFSPINIYSLENYILSTTAENSDNKTIKNNLRDAKTICMIAQECNNQLPQIVNHSTFGRTYYRGINLQSVHKTVRHAALGSCYSVDIDSSVINWKYSMMSSNTQQQMTYTRELIKDKNRIRKHLAKVVFGNSNEYSIKTIKRVITAISFGAKESGKGFYFNKKWTPNNEEPKYISSSVDTIIKSPENRKTLFNDPWMKSFMAEQKEINDAIYKMLVDGLKAGDIVEDTVKELRSAAGRISPAKFIAWMYQHSEQQVMKEILKWSRTEVLLQVHDGVYFKNKPDMPSMQTVLQNHWPLATLSIESVDNYHHVNREELDEHKEFIREQEVAANDGVDPGTTGIHTEQLAVKQYDTHSEPDWVKEQMKEYYQHFPQPDPNMPDFARRRLS